MTLLETMHARIRENKASQDIVSVRSSTRDWKALNRNLAAINRMATVPERGVVDEVFLGDDVEDDRDFTFTRITRNKKSQALIDALIADADTQERWDFKGWLNRGLANRQTVIGVQREGQPGIAGFVILSTALDVRDLKKEPNIVLDVHLEAVYILPKFRRQGFSQALSWVAAMYVDSVIDQVNDMPKADRMVIEDLEFELFIRGEAHSAGGARFLSETVDWITSNVEMDMFLEDRLRPTVIDDVDFSDFPDCGFGDEGDEIGPSSAHPSGHAP